MKTACLTMTLHQKSGTLALFASTGETLLIVRFFVLVDISAVSMGLVLASRKAVIAMVLLIYPRKV